jgi:hypothetical protein
MAAAVVLVLAGIAGAQVSLWHSNWDAGRDDWDEILAMALTPEEDVVATGFSRIAGPGRSVMEIATVKFAAGDGDVRWSRTFHLNSVSSDEPRAIAVDAAGSVFVVGRSDTRSADSTDLVVLKYLADGTPAWSVRYHYVLIDVATAVVVDGAGGCYVAGYSSRGAANLDFLVVHYDTDGNESWLTRLNGAADGNDAANALVADGAGHLYAAGYTWTGAVDQEAYWLVKLDAATGDTVWTRTYNGAAGVGDPRDDRANALALGPGGNVYVTGRAGEAGTWYDATTVAWDPAGNRLWVNRFDAGHNSTDAAGEIAVDAAGNVYCGGVTYEYFNDSELDFLLFRINAGGALDWQRVYDSGVNEDDSCTGLVLDAAGNVYATGIGYDNSGCPDWVTLKYSPSGVRRWLNIVGVYDEDDYANAILLDSRGAIYVGGMDYYEGGEDFAVRKYSQSDVGAGRVLEPVDTLRTWAEVRPRVWVRNYSAVPASFPVWLYIGNFYFDVRNVNGLGAHDSVLVEFEPWRVRDVGDHRVVCFTAMAGDNAPENDSVFGTVTTVPVWQMLAPMPVSQAGRPREVKDGGALVAVDDSLIFALKGNNTNEFYRYSVGRDSWRTEDSVPYSTSGRRKRVKRGARLTVDSERRIYALKGNNTDEFWRYNVAGSTGWQPLPAYPLGGGRRVKGGSGLEYVESQGRIYSAKGSNTHEFFAYDVAGDSWLRMADVDAGPRGRAVKPGSCMAYDGGDTIYLLKANYQEFSAYSISTDAWRSKPGLPYSAFGRKRKAKKGAGLAWDGSAGRLYAAKGGKAAEWWYFDVARDTWVEIVQDSIPTGPARKPPYAGSAMEMGAGKIYFLRGNKTLEFWRYNASFPLGLPAGGGSGGPAAAAAMPAGYPRAPELSVVPNPFAGQAQLCFSLPVPGRVRLVLYDVAGREALRLLDEERRAGEYRVALAGAGLARGVYLAQLSLAAPSGNLTVQEKVVLTHDRR